MRNRLVASASVVTVAVLAAGAPVIATGVDQVKDAQRRVDRAEAAVAAVLLAHSLADERDAMTEYVAAGRSTAAGEGAPKDVRTRVDRQAASLRASATDASVTFAGATKRLRELPRMRQRALSGPGSAADTFDAYTEAVRALHRAAGATDPNALGPLGRTVEHASGSRALLLGALASGGRQPGLTSAAYQARLREEAAFADFRQSAARSARDRYVRTVRGAKTDEAERYLKDLVGAPPATSAGSAPDRDQVGDALTARVERMRGVETALAADGVTRAEQARHDRVTELELHAGLLAGCLLLVLTVCALAVRSVTRPLGALRAGVRRLADDPADIEPLTLGRRDADRDDEFAAVVWSVNHLHEGLGSQRARVAKLAAERGQLIEDRQHQAAQIAEVRQECEEIRRLKEETETRLKGLRDRVHSSFVNLALRTLGLVERQLAVIETMEANEQDPDRLETLFTLDHLATGIRRYSENLLVIAGSERQSNHAGAVPLLDVLRAAISEVERYQRIRIQALPPQAQVAGFAADSVSHLVAELLENATIFSPPATEVHVSGWLLENGEVMLSVQDEGIGMTADRFEELNTRLADPVPEYCQGPQPEDPLGLGLYVVTRLAARHGVRVQLREQKQGGVTAVVVLPKSILPDRRPAAGGVRAVALSTGHRGFATGASVPLPAGTGLAASGINVAASGTGDDGPMSAASADRAHEGRAGLVVEVGETDGVRTVAPHGAGAAAAGGPVPGGAMAAPSTAHAAGDAGLPGSYGYGEVMRVAAEGDGLDAATTPRGATFSGVGTATRVSGVAPAPETGPAPDAPTAAAGQGPGRRRERRAEPALPRGHGHDEPRRPELTGAMPPAGEPWGPGPELAGWQGDGSVHAGDAGAVAGLAGSAGHAGPGVEVDPGGPGAVWEVRQVQGPAYQEPGAFRTEQQPADAGAGRADGAVATPGVHGADAAQGAAASVTAPVVGQDPDPLVAAAERAVRLAELAGQEVSRAPSTALEVAPGQGGVPSRRPDSREPHAVRRYEDDALRGAAPTGDGDAFHAAGLQPAPPDGLASGAAGVRGGAWVGTGLGSAAGQSAGAAPDARGLVVPPAEAVEPGQGEAQRAVTGLAGAEVGGAGAGGAEALAPGGRGPRAIGPGAGAGYDAAGPVGAIGGVVSGGAGGRAGGSPDLASAKDEWGAGASADAGVEGAVSGGAVAAGEVADGAGPRTAKGLPMRTPRVVAPRSAVASERGTVDADELRRRLGGFQQGARDGRRDAEAELAERTVAQHGQAAADSQDGELARAVGPRVASYESSFGALGLPLDEQPSVGREAAGQAAEGLSGEWPEHGPSWSGGLAADCPWPGEVRPGPSSTGPRMDGWPGGPRSEAPGGGLPAYDPPPTASSPQAAAESVRSAFDRESHQQVPYGAGGYGEGEYDPALYGQGQGVGQVPLPGELESQVPPYQGQPGYQGQQPWGGASPSDRGAQGLRESGQHPQALGVEASQAQAQQVQPQRVEAQHVEAQAQHVQPHHVEAQHVQAQTQSQRGQDQSGQDQSGWGRGVWGQDGQGDQGMQGQGVQGQDVRGDGAWGQGMQGQGAQGRQMPEHHLQDRQARDHHLQEHHSEDHLAQDHQAQEQRTQDHQAQGQRTQDHHAREQRTEEQRTQDRQAQDEQPQGRWAPHGPPQQQVGALGEGESVEEARS
ncbi:nitrate- and nitrite sensing domain-containing protein [Streptomyces sp. HSW2009]|uniref:nitrate- and nitrite sensing domain-containing protein n=1 Tax=Streptomyces sp. HSW2009 TaxID=3142890 RepID=UPI0032EC2D53